MHPMLILLLVAVGTVNICHASKGNLKHLKKHHDHHMHCFSDEELEESMETVVQRIVGHKMDWEKYNPVKLVKVLDEAENRRNRHKRNPSNTCPDFSKISEGADVYQRSISPWTYNINFDKNRYPQRLAYAECLCDHCINIKTGTEDSSLNSVLIRQSMLVLRKTTCPHNAEKHTFIMEYQSVPVACTCALPRTHTV